MLWAYRKICKRISVNCRTKSTPSDVISKVMSEMPANKELKFRDFKARTRLKYEIRKCKNQFNQGGNKNFSIEVLGNGAHGSPRAVYLFTDLFRGLFNCEEGTQRLATEYKIKITKIPHVFITYPSWENISGLLGVALSSQSIGIPELHVHGPKCIENVFSATNKFVALRSIAVKVIDCEEETEFEDGTIHIKYVPLYPSSQSIRPSTADNQKTNLNHILSAFVEPKKEEIEDDNDIDYYAHLSPAKRKKQFLNQNKKKLRSQSLDSGNSSKIFSNKKYAMSYICQSKETLGKLLIEKCVDLGVPYGPLLQKLKNGEAVTLENGVIVTSDEVTTPNTPGGIVIVLECPNENYLDALLKEPAFYRHQSGYEYDIAAAVVHFSPIEIVNHSRYKEWMDRFPSSTKHVFVNNQNKSFGSISIQRMQEKLNLVHPEIFPRLAYSNIPSFPRNEAESIPEGHSLTVVETIKQTEPNSAEMNDRDKNYSEETSESFEELLDRIYIKCEKNSFIRGETLCEIPIRPIKPYDYSRSLVLKKQYFIDEVYNLPEMKEKLEQLRNELSAMTLTNEKYPKILFLGTGSSQPNKLRNTSGILLFLDENTSILLDCGEGTYSQMVQFFGKEKTYEILKNLNVIYVSHLHADHHMGLITLLKHRYLAINSKTQSDETEKKTFRPVFLLAPIQLQRWLNMFDKEFEKISDLFLIIPNNLLMEGNFLTDKYEECLNLLCMKEIKTTLVNHCPNAFGVALIHNDGWKVTYSGDTRPCQALVELGKDSDILIHEATLDDTLQHVAAKKLHSTTSQAIQIGKEMNARFILLTHFSQRYSHLPLLTENFTDEVGIAFDNMMVSLNQLPILSKFKPVLKTMFGYYYTLMENRRDALLLKAEKKKCRYLK